MFIPVLMLTLAAPVFARRHKEVPPQGPLELKIYGPSLIRESQKLKFNAVLTNLSQAPIFLPSGYVQSSCCASLTWRITDTSGRELPLDLHEGVACPVGGPGWDNGGTHTLNDSDVRILQPGEKLEFSFDDISGSYIFQRGARNRVTFTYSYIPPRYDEHGGGPVDLSGHPYDLSSLSPANLEALKHASRLDLVSNPVIVTVIL
jgi:hypothetical protein